MVFLTSVRVGLIEMRLTGGALVANCRE